MARPRAGQSPANRVALTTTRGARPGSVSLHSAVDGFSRLASTEALPDERTTTAIGFLHRARAFFAAHGIGHIQRIVTDNGACYRAGDFARALLGSRHGTTAESSATSGSWPKSSSPPAPGHPKAIAHTL